MIKDIIILLIFSTILALILTAIYKIIVLLIKMMVFIFYSIIKIFKPNIQKPRIIMKKQKSYIRRNSAKDKYEYDHNF